MKYLFLALITLSFVSCSNDDDENTSAGTGMNTGGGDLTANSSQQFSIFNDATAISGVNGSSGWETLTSNSFSVGEPSELQYGMALYNDVAMKSFQIDFGPNDYPMGQPSQSEWYNWFTEGSREYGYGHNKVSITYIDGSNVFTTLDFDQTGSTFEIVDAVNQGDYVRLYVEFSAKVFSASDFSEGHMVASVYRY